MSIEALTAEAAAIDKASAPENSEGGVIDNAGAGSLASPEDYLNQSALVCNLMADGVQALVPGLKYSPDTRQTAAQKLAPVLQKYNLSSSWMARWSVEFDAGIFFAGLIFESVQQVRALKAQEKVHNTQASSPDAQQQIVDSTDPFSLHNLA